MPTKSFKNIFSSFLKQHIAMLSVFAICLSIQALGLQSILEFQRDNFFTQPSTLLLSHFTHITWAHLVINLAACFAINHLFFGHKHWVYVLSIIFTLAITISLELYFFSTHVQWYRGLSGVLHGFFVIGCINSFKKEKITAGLFLSAIVGKLIWEQLSADTASSMLGGALVIVDAHLWGAIAGLLLGGALIGRTLVFFKRQS